MSHVSMKLRVLQKFCKNSDSFLSIAQNWFVRAAHDKNTFIQSFNIGCDSPVGIQIKIQIGQISELDSNLKLEYAGYQMGMDTEK